MLKQTAALLLAAASLCVLFAAVGAAGEEPHQEGVLAPVVVEAPREEAPLDVPTAFSTVIDVERFAGEFNTTAELLSATPGLQVRDFGGFGQLKTVSIRGSASNQVVILLDGVRISSPMGAGVDLSTLPLEYVDRIEIVRGGASALVGTDAIGGVVNVVTRSDSAPFTRARLTVGSFTTLSAGFTHSGRLGGVGYLISYNHAQSRGDFSFKSINGLEVERINNEFLSESLLGRVSVETSGGWRLTATSELYFDDKGVPGLGEFQEDSSNQRDLRLLTSLTAAKERFPSAAMDARLTLYHRLDVLEFKDPEPTLGVPLDTLSRMHTVAANPVLTWYAPFGQTVTVGTELRGEVLRDDDFSNPSRLTWSLYASDEVPLLDDQITLLPLARFDLFTTYGPSDSTDAALSPKLGLIVRPRRVRHLAFKANVGKSFRAPGFGELFLPERGFIGGNPDLHNERSIDFDTGVSLTYPRLSLTVDYFHNRVRDLIAFVFVSANRIEPRNIGLVVEQGLEAELALRPAEFLGVTASYTFLDGEARDTGAQLPGRARNTFDLRAELDHTPFRLYWETHFVDEIPLTPFPGSRTTEARTTHDVGLRLEWRKWYVTAEVKNLLDNKNVRDAFDFPLPGVQWYVTAGMKIRP